MIIGLSTYIVYGKVIDKDNNKEEVNSTEESLESQEKTKEYTYKDIAGNYYFETNALIEGLPEAMSKHFLVLDEDGTYSYSNILMTHSGHLGNYMIIGNTIVLNYLFSMGNDAGFRTYDGNETLQISDNGNLVMKNKNQPSEITFERTSINFEQYNVYSFDRIINNSEIVNAYTENNLNIQ